jgi:predicted  nucleic acid-binding Zn-ribbon protein
MDPKGTLAKPIPIDTARAKSELRKLLKELRALDKEITLLTEQMRRQVDDLRVTVRRRQTTPTSLAPLDRE